MVAAPAASTTRQVAAISIYNYDVAAAEVTVKKDVSGTEYILAKYTLNPGDTLFYTWGSGWNILQGAGAGDNITFSVFYSDGTYTKPAGLKYASIVCLGAGAGGGSGRRGAASTNRAGGSGGGGGAMSSLVIPASSMPPSASVTIGIGGVGGAAITADNTSGNNGSAGGNTSFGSIVIASGGNGGNGGTTGSASGGAGGSMVASTPACGPYTMGGQQGGT